jgi:uncharacterized RDD family membrane protein YckC
LGFPPPPPPDLPPPPPPQIAPPPQLAPPPALGGLGYNPGIPYAGFWIRFVAHIIDYVIASIAVAVITAAAAFLVGFLFRFAGNGDISSAEGPLTALIYLIALVIGVGYYVYGWALGSTPGMRFFRLAVVDAQTGLPIGFGRAGFRYAGYVLSSLVCYVGLIWAAFDPKKQGWHDKIAGSVVVQG